MIAPPPLEAFLFPAAPLIVSAGGGGTEKAEDMPAASALLEAIRSLPLLFLQHPARAALLSAPLLLSAAVPIVPPLNPLT